MTPQIRQSVSARSTVVTATQGVGACTMAPSKGISLMNQAISERRAVITRLGTLSVTAVPSGRQLLADFKQVLQSSIRADQGFIGWMRDTQNSGTCPVNMMMDASYQAGLQASRQANSAKHSFLKTVEPAGQPVQPAKVYRVADLTAPIRPRYCTRIWHECALSARAFRPGLDRQHKARRGRR